MAYYDISFVGRGTQGVSSTAGATVTAAWPVGYTATEGDVAVLIGAGKHSFGASNEPATPNGWELAGTSFRSVGTYDLQLVAWIKGLSAGEAAPTLTVPTVYSGTSGGLSAQVAVFRSVDSSSFQDVTAEQSNAAGLQIWAPTGLTTATDKALVLSMVASADDNALALLDAQGFTARISGAAYDTAIGGDHAVGLATRLVETAGTPVMPTWQQTVAFPDAWAGLTLALRPAVMLDIVGSLSKAQEEQGLSASGALLIAAALAQNQEAQTLSSAVAAAIQGAAVLAQADQTAQAAGSVLIGGWLEGEITLLPTLAGLTGARPALTGSVSLQSRWLH